MHLYALTILLASAAASTASQSCDRLALVTGASGRVGKKAVALLLGEKVCVRVFSRNISAAVEKLGTGPRLDFVEGDLGDPAAVRAAFAYGDAAVTHVLFAAGGEEADFDAVNYRGVSYCAEEAALAGVETMVVISSGWVTRPSVMHCRARRIAHRRHA